MRVAWQMELNKTPRSTGANEYDSADGKGLRGIAMIATDVNSDVDGNDIAVFGRSTGPR